MLIDKHNREVNYLRLAVTDKCNLRCTYCMPENIKFVNNKELLSYEEMIRIVQILVNNGINKVRITGGEPFLRKNIMYLFESLAKIDGLDKIAITSNATHTLQYLPRLLELGIRAFNISIDSLDKDRFYAITRRDYYEDVLACIEEMMKHDLELSLNCVVMKDKNTEDIIPFVELTRHKKISVRFIEEMPFNGNGTGHSGIDWNYVKILDHIQSRYPDIHKLKDAKNSTSLNYQVSGFEGSLGVIPAFTRSFCGTCNRIRITALGKFKTCLYDDGVFNIKDFMRQGATDEQVLEIVKQALAHKSKDGFEAENRRKFMVSESMSTIGG